MHYEDDDELIQNTVRYRKATQRHRDRLFSKLKRREKKKPGKLIAESTTTRPTFYRPIVDFC